MGLFMPINHLPSDFDGEPIPSRRSSLDTAPLFPSLRQPQALVATSITKSVIVPRTSDDNHFSTFEVLRRGME
jgi:hypothetical protein